MTNGSRQHAFFQHVIAGAAAMAIALGAPGAMADEGMWTFDNFPAARVKAKYGSAPDQAWLDRIQAASVRLPGCSASFVSPEGLILTNWHCVQGCVSQLSSAENDLAAKGVSARTRAEERMCPGFRAQVLTSIADVTARVRAATASAPVEQFTAVRDREINAIQVEACKDLKDTDCNVISLYRGGQFKLHIYRNYTDVRLVFAPEYATGFFGGDPDNFNFPRYALDAAFLRAYIDGKPAATPFYLKWRNEAPKPGELTYIAGNPGATQRLFTVDQLRLQRDVVNPFTITLNSERRGRIDSYGGASPEARRQANETLFGLENGFKVALGQQAALLDPVFIGNVEKAEAGLRAEIAKRPELAAEIGDPWAEIAAANLEIRKNFRENFFVNNGPGSTNFVIARQLVRLVEERAKPEKERLPGFSDAAIARARDGLMRSFPPRPELERIALEFWLLRMREYLGADHEMVRLVLGRESPETLAKRLVEATGLSDPKMRLALFEGGVAAIAGSNDPMIQLVRALEPRARALADIQRAKIAGPIGRAAERIAKARFAVYGDSLYPDATSTLRLSFGVIEGWTHEGRTVDPFTKFGGLYARATGSFPFALATSWTAAQGKLNPETPFNVSSSHDIIGGNSGSPLLDSEGRVLGAAFDGNIHSLGGAYAYDGRVNRTVSVLSGAITEALRKVYDLPQLAAELEGPVAASGKPAKKGKKG